MKTKLLVLVVIAMIICNHSFSQPQGSAIWYFGHNAGLKFVNNNPVALSDGQIYTGEGSSVVSDINGNLLFYTEGTTVWNKNHVIMPNGTGLNGDYSSTQTIIVQIPNNCMQYYIFYQSGQYGLTAYYSIVDMSLNGGLGDVVIASKNTYLFYPATEKITAIKHQNGTDVWVLFHEYNTNKFLSYLVTPAGINSPINTNVGPIHHNMIGYMKASHSGNKLADAITFTPDIRVELYDFNKSTGVMSNPVLFNNWSGAYGLEFSPNDNLLYATSYWGTNKLYQINLSNNTFQTIASASNGNYDMCALQLGPNGKIYMARGNQNYLSVINSPNTLGTGCNFVANGFTLAPGTIGILGLPTFDQSLFNETMVLTCPSDITVNNDPSLCGAIVNYSVTTETNCQIPLVNQSEGLSTGSVFPVGTTTNTYIVSDISGNTSSCSFTVTVNDVEGPTINCPVDINQGMDEGLCHASVDLGLPTTSDNCGVASVDNDGPSTYTLGTTIVTWTVTDNNGLTASCQQTVTITDNQPPSITCPVDIIQTMDAGSCYATIDLGNPITSDNCGVAAVDNDGLATYPLGTTTVTWTVTDNNGLTSTCQQLVTVTDNELPTITCPGNISANYDEHVYYSILASDNCQGYLISQNQGFPSGAIFPVGNTLNTFVVTDASGNSAACSFTVNVADPCVNINVAISGTNIDCHGAISGTTSGSTTIYSGYGTQTITLSASASLGLAPYSYLWSTGATTSTITCSPLSTTVYSVTVTDAIGCTASAINNGFRVNVVNVSCGSGKVYLCHVPPGNTGNPQTLCISVNAVPAHLSNHPEDCLGQCNTLGKIYFENENEESPISIYPNPFSYNTTLQFTLAENDNVKIDIIDISGKLIQTLFNGDVNKDKLYTVNFNGEKLATGIYMYKMTTLNEVYTGKIVFIKER